MKNRIAFCTILMVLTLGFVFSTSGNNEKLNSLPLNPKADATVTINFDGLMAICMGDPARVSVATLSVPNHTPVLKIEKVSNGERTTIAEFDQELLRQSIYINSEMANAPAVASYQTNPATDKNDFRWTVDF